MAVRRADGAARGPALVDRWTSGFRLAERHDVEVPTSPAAALEAALGLPLQDLPLTRALFRLRGIGFGRAQTIGALFTTAPFLLLEEAAGVEVVVGIAAVGTRPLALGSPEAFRAAARTAGLAAVACFRAEGAAGGTLLSTETWVRNNGMAARIAFGAYWLVVGRFSALIRREMLAGAARRVGPGR